MGMNAQTKQNHQPTKNLRMSLAFAFGLMLALMTGFTLEAQAQNHGNKPVGGISNTTAQQHPMAGSVVQCKKKLNTNGRQVEFTVAGQMPVNAAVNAEAVSRTAPDGRQPLAAYDISIKAGNNAWQPQAGHPVQVSIASTSFPDGTPLDMLHQTELGYEYVATVTPVNGMITFPAKAFSVYIVVESGADARLKVNFKSGSDTIASMMVKLADTAAAYFNTIVYDPGVGNLASGVVL